VSDIKVIQGDCRLVLPALNLDTTYAIIADPPYGISHSSNYGATWEGTQIRNDHNSDLSDWIIAWSESQGIPWAVFGNWKCQRPPQARGVLIWDKGPAFGMGDLAFPWKMSWEEIYVGGPGWKGARDEGVLRGHMVLSWESKGRKHPHQKPVSLIGHLLSKLPKGLTVVDPCVGSGSTLVACRKAGRGAVGIEVDSDLLPLIRRRVRDAATPLFRDGV
jgi:DNA modification methylase